MIHSGEKRLVCIHSDTLSKISINKLTRLFDECSAHNMLYREIDHKSSVSDHSTSSGGAPSHYFSILMRRIVDAYTSTFVMDYDHIN